MDNDSNYFCMLNRLPPAFVYFLPIKGPAQPTHEEQLKNQKQSILPSLYFICQERPGVLNT